MQVRFTLPSVIIQDISTTRVSVRRGEVFGLQVIGALGGASWFASNDPVLDITEGANGSATIKAAQTGVSVIEVRRGPTVLARLHFTVYKDRSEEAVRFTAEIGPELPK